MYRLWLWDREVQQVWVCSHRVHHGLIGLLLAIFGIVLMAHDRRDFRVWLRRAKLIV